MRAARRERARQRTVAPRPRHPSITSCHARRLTNQPVFLPLRARKCPYSSGLAVAKRSSLKSMLMELPAAQCQARSCQAVTCVRSSPLPRASISPRQFPS